MFYSHEVLTNRQYGVATVWLVATLGSKSTHKRISRKAILDVDVEKACKTIIAPVTPMALRLQSNLLYGLARVYSQQCGYVLTDAEAARNSMHAVFKVLRNSALEVGGHTGRADQLILQDDPNFLPDFDLIPIDPDQLNFDISTTAEDTQRSTLSPYSSQTVAGSQKVSSLHIPGESSAFIDSPNHGLGNFRVRGDHGTGQRVEDRGILEDDLGITVDPDGTMHFSDVPRLSEGSRSKIDGTDAWRASMGARLEHESDQLGLKQPDCADFVPIQEDHAPESVGQVVMPRSVPSSPQQTTNSKTADSPVRRHIRATPKVMVSDGILEFRNRDIIRWNTEYATNMQEAIRQKHAGRIAAMAKKNAEYWVLEASGLAALGQADRLVQGPLEMFSGAKLLETTMSVRFPPGGAKRRLEDDAESESRRVRVEPSSDEVGRGGFDDRHVPTMDDDYPAAEQGREAPTPLNDRHLSSVYPWNQSTGSRRLTGFFGSASAVGATGQSAILSHRRRRLLSASPLADRGLARADTAGMYKQQQEQYLYEEEPDDVGMTGIDEFELFGQGTEVDSQAAQQSQWQHAILDSESFNFLAFVQAGIEDADKARVQLGVEDDILNNSIDFERLLPSETNGRTVAAQGLLHVLALGTRNMLHVEQENPFGVIALHLVVA